MSIKIQSSTKEYSINFYSTIENLIDSFQDKSLLFLIDENVYNLYTNHFKDKNYYIIRHKCSN